MSKKSRRRNKKILGALGALGALALAARGRRNASIADNEAKESGLDIKIPEPKKVKSTTPKAVTGTKYPGENKARVFPKLKVSEKGYVTKDGVGQGFTGPGKFVTGDGVFVKGKKVSETAPKGILVRKDGTIKAGGKEFLNKSQYASRNEKPAMLSDSMFYEGVSEPVESFKTSEFDYFAKGGRVKKKPFAKRGFGRAYKKGRR